MLEELKNDIFLRKNRLQKFIQTHTFNEIFYIGRELEKELERQQKYISIEEKCYEMLLAEEVTSQKILKLFEVESQSNEVSELFRRGTQLDLEHYLELSVNIFLELHEILRELPRMFYAELMVRSKFSENSLMKTIWEKEINQKEKLLEKLKLEIVERIYKAEIYFKKSLEKELEKLKGSPEKIQIGGLLEDEMRKNEIEKVLTESENPEDPELAWKYFQKKANEREKLNEKHKKKIEKILIEIEKYRKYKLELKNKELERNDDDNEEFHIDDENIS